MKIIKNDYFITDVSSDVNIKFVEELLSKTYWAKKRPLEVIKQSIEHSICFSLYKQDQQIGFARMVTDYSTFGYLADAIIAEEHRGLGLGKWFVSTIINDKRWGNILLILATKDAHGLYEKYGFKNNEKLMMRMKI